MSARDNDGAFDRIGPANDDRAASSTGATYGVVDGALLRLAPLPEKVLVARMPWPLSMVGGAIEVTVLLTLGGVGLVAGFLLTTRSRT